MGTQAVAAMLLIVFGSRIAAAAPGDGQTGMVTFPLWVLGGWLGVGAIKDAWEVRSETPAALVGVGLCMLVAVVSIAWSVRVMRKPLKDGPSQRSLENRAEE
ncbi:MAG: hypothetical protein HONBIEJF_01509 [Fimbriimonadaceae bacterium]|nr:hypothetical protein [Fimbriimonadaceae bacterium]